MLSFQVEIGLETLGPADTPMKASHHLVQLSLATALAKVRPLRP
jgi:hypothetical protein